MAGRHETTGVRQRQIIEAAQHCLSGDRGDHQPGGKKRSRKGWENLKQDREERRRLLAKGAARGEIRPDIDLDGAATLIFGMVQGLANLWTGGNGGFHLVERYGEP